MYKTLETFLLNSTPEQIVCYDFKNESPWAGVCNEQDSLEKFRKYRTFNKTSTIKFDCDNSNGSCPLTDSIYNYLWGWTFQSRYELPRQMETMFSDYWNRLGSDTINSFFTTYTQAVKLVGEKAAKKNPLLHKFASLTHSVGNFTLVPFHLLPGDQKSFNQYRGANFGKYFVCDYFDLSLKIIQENVSREVFINYIDTFFLNDYVDQQYNILPLFKRHAKYLSETHLQLNSPADFLPQTENELNEYLQNVIKLIQVRGYRIAAQLTGQDYHSKPVIENEAIGISELDAWHGAKGIKGFYLAAAKEVRFAVQSIRHTTLDSLALLMPLLVAFIGFVFAIVSVVQFVIDGGYSSQIEMVKKIGLFGTDQLFTSGTISVIYSGTTGVVLLVLILISLLLVCIQFLKNAHWLKKVTAIILGASTIIAYAICKAFRAIESKTIELNDKQTEQFISYFGSFTEEQITNQISILTGVGIAFLLILLIILISTKKCRPSIRYVIFAGFSIYLICPAMISLVENLIPLGILAIITVVGILISRFVTNNMDEEDGQPTFSTPDRNKESSKSNVSLTEYHASRGIKFRKVKGLTCDFIERYNSLGGNSMVCTVYQLENDKYKIYDEHGNRLVAKDIPWK